METIHLVFRLLAVSQVVFLIAYLLLFKRSGNGLFLSLLGFGFFAYLMQPLVLFEFGRGYLLYCLSFVATAVPAILWLVGNRFFNDNEHIPAWFLLCCLTYMGLWYAGDLGIINLENAELAAIFFELVPQLIKLGLVGHVIAMALSGRESDLMLRRLKLRTPVALAASTVIGIVILVELWAGGEMPLLIEAIGSVCMFLFALLSSLFLLRWQDDLPLRDIRNAAETSASHVGDDHSKELIERIEKAMTEERFYAGHGKTLADLAQELDVPPYRLRNQINKYMGFQNFNQFLNHYRIEEAATRLRQQSKLPVLSIALDVGFKSISSFNAAFKSIHKTTPSDYRKNA